MATGTMVVRKKRIPWNKDRKVGERIAFTQGHLLLLSQILLEKGETHDLALFMVGVDTLLRASDLLMLRVRDIVRRDGTIRSAFPWQQKKTDIAVSPILTPSATEALLAWIKQSGKGTNDYLFTRHKPRHAKPITEDYYRKLVKQWTVKLGLDPSEYSTHSIRRTKAVFVYHRGGDLALIADLLGHTNTDTVMKYLGIRTEEARKLALEHDIFDPKNKPYERTQTSIRLSDTDVRRIAVGVVDELEDRGLVVAHPMTEADARRIAVYTVQELLNTDLFNLPTTSTL